MIGAGVLDADADEIGAALGASVRGEGGVRLRRVGVLADADAATLTFIRDARHAGDWAASGAGAAIVSEAAAGAGGLEPGPGRALLVVGDADLALAQLLTRLAPPVWGPRGVHPAAVVEAVDGLGADVSIGAGAVVGPGTTIGPGGVIHPGVVIGADVTIGTGCRLHPGVVVYDRCVLGDGVIVHANAVIGADGFGYVAAPGGGGVVKTPHVGNVVIGDGVEVGAGACIDRGKLGATTIGAGTKIDNLVQIGHNCVIGRSCIICGCSGLAGSVTLGDGVTVAAGSGVADNITIGSGATLAARSGVMRDVPPGSVWAGLPAREAREAMKIHAAQPQLPDILKRLKRLEAALGGRGDGA